MTRKLDEFEGYRKSLLLFDCVVEDMRRLASNPDLMRLRSQQLASADSICANLEEGSGRWSSAEFIQYCVISRGSAVETVGRYKRFHHWLPEEIIAERVALCEEIIAILTATINKMKKRQS